MRALSRRDAARPRRWCVKPFWVLISFCVLVLVNVSIVGTIAILSKNEDRELHESRIEKRRTETSNEKFEESITRGRSDKYIQHALPRVILAKPKSQNLTSPAIDAGFDMPVRKTSNLTIGFVHVGKTGGSTLSSLLRNGCNSISIVGEGGCNRNIDPATESVVSKLVEHYYHVPDFWRLPTTRHKAYIITARDVFDRTVSAFLYQHPENSKAFGIKLTGSRKMISPEAYKCYPSLDTFAGNLSMYHKTTGTIYKNPDADAGDNVAYESSRPDCEYPYRQNEVSAENCATLACAALHGNVRFYTHLFFNFRNVLYTKLPPGRKIYVIRQEFLWDDWNNLNRMLSESNTRPAVNVQRVEHLRNVSHVKPPVTRKISTRARAILCRGLESEYIAYFRILRRAQNLDDTKRRESLQVAQRNCPNLDMNRLSKM